MIIALGSLTLLAACSGAAPAAGWSGATVSDSIVYFGGTNGKLYALDANGGAMKWSFAGEKDKPIGAIYGTPAVDNGRVYIGGMDGTLYALDAASGQMKWRFDAPAAVADKRGIIPSPVVSNGVVYVGANDYNFYAVDAETGKIKWQFATHEKVWGTATVSDGTIYFGSLDHHLYALDLAGKLKWAYDAGGMVISKPLVSNGALYFGALQKLIALDHLNDSAPQVKWTHELPPEHWIWSDPTIQDNTLYVGDLGGLVNAIDAQTGQPKWSQPFDAGAPIRSSIALATPAAFFGATTNNKVFSIDAGTAQQKWVYTAAGPVYATPAVDGGNLYVNTHGHIFYALNATDGTVKWAFDETKEAPASTTPPPQ